MKSRQELKRDYQRREKPTGVFQIKNTGNGKVFLGSSLNLEGSLNLHRFTLSTDGHTNRVLQQDWHAYGSGAFVFEVLEVVKASDAPYFNLDDELLLLEQIWLEQLQPFGERGYNRDANIRQA